MNRHYSITINKGSEYEWRRVDVSACVGKTESLEEILAGKLGWKDGRYLIQVEMSISVIEAEITEPEPAEKLEHLIF